MSKNKIEKQVTREAILQWEEQQRRAYKAGGLSPARIKKLEALPGWTWESESKPESKSKFMP